VGEEADHAALRPLKGLFAKAVNENSLDRMRPHLNQPLLIGGARDPRDCPQRFYGDGVEGE
jgi:hypothetical protein